MLPNTLTKDEQWRWLWEYKRQRICGSGEEARKILVNANLRLVYKLANRYRALGEGRGLEFDELISEGVLGLLDAIDDFEPERGFELSTFAYYRIRDRIQRAINRQRQRELSLDAPVDEGEGETRFGELIAEDSATPESHFFAQEFGELVARIDTTALSRNWLRR